MLEKIVSEMNENKVKDMKLLMIYHKNPSKPLQKTFYYPQS